MLNNVIYLILVLIILFSLYHFVKDMFIIFNNWWYSENIFTKVYDRLKQFHYNFF